MCVQAVKKILLTFENEVREGNTKDIEMGNNGTPWVSLGGISLKQSCWSIYNFK